MAFKISGTTVIDNSATVYFWYIVNRPTFCYIATGAGGVILATGNTYQTGDALYFGGF